jgi:hypothetical protein
MIHHSRWRCTCRCPRGILGLESDGVGLGQNLRSCREIGHTKDYKGCLYLLLRCSRNKKRVCTASSRLYLCFIKPLKPNIGLQMQSLKSKCNLPKVFANINSDYFISNLPRIQSRDRVLK